MEIKDFQSLFFIISKVCNFDITCDIMPLKFEKERGISFEKRKDFFKLPDEIIDHRVERVVIPYKDRLSRVGFDLFYHLFE